MVRIMQQMKHVETKRLVQNKAIVRVVNQNYQLDISLEKVFSVRFSVKTFHTNELFPRLRSMMVVNF